MEGCAGQALIQAARPRSVIAPVLFGLGVEFDHIFGLKWAISQLYSLGFSISTDEVALFKNSILQDEEQYSLTTPVQVESSATDSETPCYQYVADNADANIGTCDRVEEGGYKIQTSLDNKPYTEAKIQRKDHIRTLLDLLPGVTVGKKAIHVDPTTLFLRCVEVAKRLV